MNNSALGKEFNQGGDEVAARRMNRLGKTRVDRTHTGAVVDAESYLETEKAGC